MFAEEYVGDFHADMNTAIASGNFVVCALEPNSAMEVVPVIEAPRLARVTRTSKKDSNLLKEPNA